MFPSVISTGAKRNGEITDIGMIRNNCMAVIYSPEVNAFAGSGLD